MFDNTLNDLEISNIFAYNFGMEIPCDKTTFQNDLLNWYDKHARILPWRQTKDPYHIWVSEIMLQQTRVEAVKTYFAKFILEVPSVSNLANLSDERLMKLWQGLGYYSRATSLKKGAKQVMEEFSGVIPKSASQLIKLSGIGDYTAGAISSIAFDEKVPCVDGNVMRVFARILAMQDDITQKTTKTKITEIVCSVLPNKRVGDFNQALMEIGATVCLPNGAPKCEKCPFATICKAKNQNLTSQIPFKSKKSARKIEQRTVILLQSENKFAISKRHEKGLLANLWQFPNINGHLNKQEVEHWLKTQNIIFESVQLLEKAKHIFTHIEWHMVGYLVKLDASFKVPNEISFLTQSSNAPLVWKTSVNIAKEYSIPNAFKSYVKYLS